MKEETKVKKIEAIIRTEKLTPVKDALAKNGFPGLTTFDVKGRGRQSGVFQTIQGQVIYADLLPKTKIEVIVNDEDLEEALEIIIENAQTGSIGAGKIFVQPIEEVIRIRTGERGADAV